MRLRYNLENGRFVMRIFVLLIGIIFMLPFISSVECGSTPTDGCDVTQNTTFNTANYSLPNGINILASNIFLDCNDSILEGNNSGTGVDIRNNRDSNLIKNCIIQNYSDGAFLTGATGGVASYNLFERNIFRYNLISGLTLDGSTEYSNVSLNYFIENVRGLIMTTATSKFNKAWNNNFINNSAFQGTDNGISNVWNFSREKGNYWSNFDEPSEGCDDIDKNLICDTPYNVSGSAGSRDYFPFIVEDGWTLGPKIREIIPIQVVEDVDMVKGKTTLIRILVNFTSVLGNDTITPNVTLYWNNTFIGENSTHLMNHGESANFDFWYVPSTAGIDIDIRTEVNGTSENGIDYFDENTKDVDVVETRELTLTFVAVDNPSNFEDFVDDSVAFLQKTYPLGNDRILANSKDSINSSLSGLFKTQKILKNVYKASLVNGEYPEVAVGVVREGWFGDVLSRPDAVGIHGRFYPSVIVEEGASDNVAHELGHEYGLCDEYDELTWSMHNGFIFNLCSNGDTDNNNELDPVCIPNGCPTSSLEPLSDFSDNETLYNFMGEPTNTPWIAEDSYGQLLEEFSHSTPEFAQQRVLISGIYSNLTNEVTFDNFYILEEGLANNRSELASGEFSVQSLNSSGGVMSNLSFNLTFALLFRGGNTTFVNETMFTFVLPFDENVTSILFMNETLIEQVNRSENNPKINITTNLQDNKFSNQLFNISWNSSDADNDTLAYAILFSSNNGISYDTLEIDYNEPLIELNSSELSDCDNCRVKILVTDGFNTNSTISESFSIDNDLSINNLSVVYQSNNERVFKFDISNTFDNQTISNISWSLDMGESVINSNSSMNLTLQPLEEALIFVYYNYTSSGNYSVMATAYNELYSERRSLNITL